MASKFENVYQLKIHLKYSHPPIWRRVLVPENITLSDLHMVIQRAMGWYNEHLYEFFIDGVYYGEFEDVKDATRVRLNKVVPMEKAKFTYEYDFGDGWTHEITVEKILPREPGELYPKCIKGKRACPPEDVGGIMGYEWFLEALKDPEHPEHEEMVEWIGEDFDPEEFSLEECDGALEYLKRKYSGKGK